MKTRMTRRRFAVLAGFLAAAMLGTTAASATVTADGEIYACKTRAGYFRQVNMTTKCKPGEKKVSWNQSGPMGPMGPTGQAGQDGANGKDGAAGPQGPKGDKGLTGNVGPAGLKGDAGPTGPKGEDGTDGKNGADGADGKDGKDGGVVVLQSITLTLPGVGKVTCYNNTSTNPAKPAMSKCDKGSGPAAVNPNDSDGPLAPEPTPSASASAK